MKNVPYVVQIVDSFKTPSELILLLQRGIRGNLLKLIKSDEYFQRFENVVSFLSKLVQGVQGIHAKNYSHSDLKLENIVVTDDYMPLIIDFDLAVRLNSVDNTRGTRSYMAPEILKAMSNGGMLIFKESIDVYALGVIFYAMVKKVFPVALNGFGYNQLKKSKIRFSIGDRVDFLELTSMMLTSNDHRSSLPEVKEKIDTMRLKPSMETLTHPELVSLLPGISMHVYSDSSSQANNEMADSPSYKDRQNEQNTFNNVEMIVIFSLAGLMIGGIILLIYFSRSTNDKILTNSFSYNGDSSFKQDSLSSEYSHKVI